ncbi:hypothetical protein J3R30DRAFT_1083683 [Lentinula aciculospora]|uniref:Uncharacterized protein n=1 Tax=Lentinula aciculospora TaxID=153920 RepID=A0A9W9A0C6_9AGAR|nr:hypothetical protein J3R30DRAFT_1083683 [Lentinula aciculospora]
MIKPQTHDFLTDFRSNAVHRHPKIEGFADDTLLNTEESEPLKLPKVEEDLLPKKEKEPESYVSEERIRLWNELQALRQAEAQNDQAQFRMQDPSNTRFVNFDRSRDMPVKNEEPDSRSSPSKSVGLERRPKIEGSDDALVPRKGASEGQLEMQHFSNARVTNMEGLGNGKEPDRRRIEPGSLDRRKEKKFDYAPERRSGNNPSNFPHVVKHERNDRNSSDSEQSRVGSPSAQANSGGHYDIKRVKREHCKQAIFAGPICGPLLCSIL